MKVLQKFISIISILAILLIQTAPVRAQELETPAPLASPSSDPAPPPSSSPLPDPSPSPIPSAEPQTTPAPTPVSSPIPDTLQSQVSLPVTPESSPTGNIVSTGNIGDTAIVTGANTTSAVIANIDASLNTLTPVSSPSATPVATEAISTSTTNTDTVNQTNITEITNTLKQTASTGSNSASLNTGNTSISTGNANVSGTIITSINTNINSLSVAEFNVDDTQKGDLILDIKEGCKECEKKEVVNTSTFQNNEAAIENNLILSADSGNNLSEKNIAGDSAIQTGNANVSASALTLANNNISGNVIYGSVNIYGDLIGDIVMPEALLNSCLECIKEASLDGNMLVQQSNTAVIENNLVVSSITGENEVKENSGGDAAIISGDVSNTVQVVNIANANITSEKENWWMVIVNNAGSWIGKILGAKEGDTMFGSSGSQFNASQQGEVSATSSAEKAFDTIQTNDVSIINNFEISANTGKNKVSENSGGSVGIETGDAKTITNIINFVNNNIAGGKKLVVAVVNIFGNWVGDFVGPGMKAQGSTKDDSGESTETNSQEDKAKDETTSDQEEAQNNDQTDDSQAKTTSVRFRSRTRVVARRSARVASFRSQVEDVAGAVSESIEEEASFIQPDKKVIKINLAWGLIGLPVFGGVALGFQFFKNFFPRKED